MIIKVGENWNFRALEKIFYNFVKLINLMASKEE